MYRTFFCFLYTRSFEDTIGVQIQILLQKITATSSSNSWMP